MIIGFSEYQILDAITVSILLLLLLKILIYPIYGLLTPFINIILLMIFFFISLKNNLIYKLREKILVPMIQKLVGYNYYRHNIYGVINDEDTYIEYPDTYLGSFYFYLVFFFQKIGRKIYFCLIYFRLLFLSLSFYAIIGQQILILLFVFNKSFFLLFILLFIINFSKLCFLISDFTLHKLYLNLLFHLNFEINLQTEVIKLNINNTYLLMFWSLRTLDYRNELLETFDYVSSAQYIEEKIETHHLKDKIEKTLKKPLNSFFYFCMFILFSMRFFYPANLDFFEFTLGFISRTSFLSNFSFFKEKLNHYCSYFSREISNDSVEVTIFPITSMYKNTLSNQMLTDIGPNINNLNLHSAIGENCTRLIMSKRAFSLLEKNFNASLQHSFFNSRKRAHFEYLNKQIENRIVNFADPNVSPKLPGTPTNTIVLNELNGEQYRFLVISHDIKSSVVLTTTEAFNYNKVVLSENTLLREKNLADHLKEIGTLRDTNGIYSRDMYNAHKNLNQNLNKSDLDSLD